MSSPPKPRKTVHYSRDTKGSHSKHHSHSSSKDSGLGTSSSASSDHASLGQTTQRQNSGLSYSDIEAQRYNLSAVQEALDSAHAKIRQLEAANTKLNAALTESNKENRLLKREKADLINKVEDLTDDLEDEKALTKSLKRASRDGSRSPRTLLAAPPSRRKSITPPEYQRPKSSHRHSYTVPSAPQPPHNSNPNPFTPLSDRPGGVAFPQSQVSYANGNLAYAPGPVFAHAPPSVISSTRGSVPNDGKYHLTPL